MREQLEWFAEEMEVQLLTNDHKGGWQKDACSENYLYFRLVEEVGELMKAGLEGAAHTTIIKEAVDVANFAMMIADRNR